MSKRYYEVMVVKTHWIGVEASSDEEAYEQAKHLIPSFSSEFEETSMEIVSCEEDF